MKNDMKSKKMKARIIKGNAPASQDSFFSQVQKAHKKEVKKEGSKAVEECSSTESSTSYGKYFGPEYNAKSLRQVVEHSTILPQCITAYKNNLVGFGYGFEFHSGKGEGVYTPEQLAEKKKYSEIVDIFSPDMSLKSLFEQVIEDRESTGTGYMEVERDGAGLPVHGYYVDAATIEVSHLGEPVRVESYRKGKSFTMMKRFRVYKQVSSTCGTAQTVYFKEFGDPRALSCKTGKFAKAGEILTDAEEANEILAFPQGKGPFGKVRWLGQAVHAEGSRLSENLNYNYFEKGRHTNLAMIIEGGTLTDDSFANLTDYVSGVQGVDNSHKMMLIEVDTLEGESNTLLEDDGKKSKPTVKLEKLNELLQEDALFLGYQDDSRKKIQSSFNLPDLYVGYTSDFNRATAEAAIEVTERQVFGPMREDLEWIINNKLFAQYGFKDCYFKYNGPTLADPTYITETFKAATAAGGITPKDARKFAKKVFEVELEAFREDWADIPIALQELQIQRAKNQMDSTGTTLDTDKKDSKESQPVAENEQ